MKISYGFNLFNFNHKSYLFKLNKYYINKFINFIKSNLIEIKLINQIN